MKSFRSQSQYYRERAVRMAGLGESGIVDAAYAKAQVAHDLAWARYYADRAKGRIPTPPTVTVEDRMALEQARAVQGDESMQDYLDTSLDDELE